LLLLAALRRILTPLPAGKKSLDGGAAPAGSGKTAPAEFSAGKRKKSRRITPPSLWSGKNEPEKLPAARKKTAA
jgi:hypothetical protein